MQFVIEAAKYENVLPLDDRRVERFLPGIAGRPTLVQGDSQLLFAGMGRLSEASVISLKNRSWSVTAEVELPDVANGVIIAQGGRFGGWALYALNGRLRYCYNLFGQQQTTVESDVSLAAGTHQLRMAFVYEGGGLAKGGTITLYVDGSPAGSGDLHATQPVIFSADETCDIGQDTGSMVSTDYTQASSHFNGKVLWVQLDRDREDFDHLITPEERLNVAMARQ